MSTVKNEPKRISRAARQQRILELIVTSEITSQSELLSILADQGITVSQGTLSKDLLEIGAVRMRNSSGALVYDAPGDYMASDHRIHQEKLARICAEILVSGQASANLAVLKTPPGAAQYFASVIDKFSNPDILGTIAGDDTVMVVSRDPDGGEALVAWFNDLASGE